MSIKAKTLFQSHFDCPYCTKLLSPQIATALINDEILINNVSSQILLKDRRLNLPTSGLNVVISVNGDIDNLTLTVITVMRKVDFVQFAHHSNIIELQENGEVKHIVNKPQRPRITIR